MCESIKVNQVGYNEHSDVRYAVLGVFLGDGGSVKFSQLPDYDVVDRKHGCDHLYRRCSLFWR